MPDVVCRCSLKSFVEVASNLWIDERSIDIRELANPIQLVGTLICQKTMLYFWMEFRFDDFDENAKSCLYAFCTTQQSPPSLTGQTLPLSKLDSAFLLLDIH